MLCSVHTVSLSNEHSCTLVGGKRFAYMGLWLCRLGLRNKAMRKNIWAATFEVRTGWCSHSSIVKYAKKKYHSEIAVKKD